MRSLPVRFHFHGAIFVLSMLVASIALAVAPINSNSSLTPSAEAGTKASFAPRETLLLRQPGKLPFVNSFTASVSTDKLDYSPGATAYITGSGFGPSEIVTLEVIHTDGTAEGGEGHLPWTVLADATGSFITSWYVNPDDSAGSTFLLTATSDSASAQTTFTDGTPPHLDQCANDPTPSLHTDGCQGLPGQHDWVNGNLGHSDSNYLEGDSIPYRLDLNSTPPGDHTVRIKWDTTKGGLHAIDYITTFNRTVATANPCLDVSVCDPNVFDEEAIPDDPQVTNAGVTPTGGKIRLYGGTIDPISASDYSYPDGTGFSGDNSTQLTLHIHTTSSEAVLAWGGHISTRKDWDQPGQPLSAIAISGSPYHTHLVDLDGSGGSQDRSLSADAVFFPVALRIIKVTNPEPQDIPQVFGYTTSGLDLSNFSLDDDPSTGNTPNLKDFTLTDETVRTITENDPSPNFSLTGLSCSQTEDPLLSAANGYKPGTAVTSPGTGLVTITPVEGETFTCTYTNSSKNVTNGRIIVKKLTDPAGDDNGGTGFSFTPKGFLSNTAFTLFDNQTKDSCGTGNPNCLTPDASGATYAVSEQSYPDYVTDASCTSSKGDPADQPSAIHLDAGETVTCTFNNHRKPQISLKKLFDPTTDGGKVDFTLNGSADNNGGAGYGNNGATPFKNAALDNNTASESGHTGTDLSNYTTTWSCNDTNNRSGTGTSILASDNLDLSYGDKVTCTFTNHRKPKIELTKSLVPTTDPGLFNLLISQSGVTKGSATDVTNNGSTGSVTVAPGTYHVSESAGTGTTGSDYTSSLSCVRRGTATTVGSTGGDVVLAYGDDIVCTFTNSKKPKIELVKDIVPNSDTGHFNLSISTGGSTVASKVNAGDGESTGTVTVVPGAYTLAETAGTNVNSLSDYASSLACVKRNTITVVSSPSNVVTLAYGDDVVCTFTNSRKPKIELKKSLVPTSDSGKFDLTIKNSSNATIDAALNVGNGGTTDANVVDPGIYNMSEAGNNTNLADYSSSLACVRRNTATSVDSTGGNVTLAFGDDVVCTFTNSRKPKIELVKDIVPNSDTGKFNLSISQSGTIKGSKTDAGDGQSTGSVTVDPGSYDLSETAGTGVSSLSDYASSLACVKRGTTTTVSSAGNAVTLAYGDDVVCTFTNSRKPKIELKKSLSPSQDPGLFNLLIKQGTSIIDSATNVTDGGTTDVNIVDPNTYNVSETAVSGTDLGDYSSSLSCVKRGTTDTVSSTGGNVTLAYGDDVVCTITNTRKTGTIQLDKLFVGGHEDVTIKIGTSVGGAQKASTPLTGVDSGSTGEKSVNTGTYYVSESLANPSHFATALACYNDVDHSNGINTGDTVHAVDGSGGVVIGYNDDVICRFTNSLLPRLELVKDLYPSNDTGRFDLKDGATVKADDVGDGGGSGVYYTTIGSHTVSEIAGTSTPATSLSDYISKVNCGSGDNSGTSLAISLSYGDNVRCTFTNTRYGKANIVKTVNGSTPVSGQSFTFELRQDASTSSDGTVLESKNTDAAGNISFTTNLVPGQTYQICEWVFPAWNTNLAGDGPLFVPNSIIPPSLPNPNVNNLAVCANFTVTPGQNRTFNVDNTPPPGGRALTIGFWKNWATCASSNGKQKAYLDLALGMASKTTTNPPGGLVVSAQNSGSGWPNYASAWNLVLKGNPSSTADSIFAAADCSKAVNLLNKSTSDGKKKMSSDPLFNMTAQLLAAELNRFSGAGISGITIMNVDRAVLLNGKYAFIGTGYSGKLNASDMNLANCLATQLDNYNNNRLVSSCP